MFKITEKAATQIQQSAKNTGVANQGLRLAAQKQEDGSISYLMGFDEEKPEDISVDANGVSVLIEPEYIPLLDGASMDYVEIDGEDRFIFLNPNDATFVPPAE